MRFVGFEYNGAHYAGVVDADTIYGLPAGVTILDLLNDGQELHAAGRAARQNPSLVLDLAAATLTSPIPKPPSIRDYMTFERHVEGTAKLVDPSASIPDQWYRAPAFYFTNPYAVCGPYEPVAIFPGGKLFDFELEVAAVVGRGGSDIPVSHAESYIAGYMLMNDWSARDVQFAEMQVRLGPVKGKDGATSLGPFFVTTDELTPYRAGNSYQLEMTAKVNGVVIGSDTWSNMAFSYAQMVAYASRGTQVRPGDLLGSGTCGGGCLAETWGRNGMSAHAPLQPGDVVSLTVDKLGEQSTTILDSVAALDEASLRATAP